MPWRRGGEKAGAATHSRHCFPRDDEKGREKVSKKGESVVAAGNGRRRREAAKKKFST